VASGAWKRHISLSHLLLGLVGLVFCLFVVDNSTPEINEDSIAFTQPHLNPLLIIGRSSLHLEGLGGTIREQCCGQKQQWFVVPGKQRHA